MTQPDTHEIHPVLGKAKLTPAEAKAQKKKLKDEGTIYWDWDDGEWIGVDPNGEHVGLASDDQTLLRYLAFYPNPTDW